MARTVLHGVAYAPVVTFTEAEDVECRLAGLTLTNGAQGIYCDDISPLIDHCQIHTHQGSGLYLMNHCDALIQHCQITDNWNAGIELDSNTRSKPHPTVSNCVITGNLGGGILGEGATVIDCVIEDNGE